MEVEGEEFPEEIVRPIKALSDENRRRIIIALTKKEEVSYSEILKQFNLAKGTLTHHLHELISAGLIRNFTKAIPESRHKSYYQLTDFGCRFIDSLYYTLAQRPVSRPITFNSITVSDDYQLGGTATVQPTITPKMPIEIT